MKKDRAPDYAFEHFNIRIMQSDLCFSQDTSTPKLDVEQPVKLADGSITCLKAVANGKPLILVTGSLSCPMTLSSLPLLKKLIKRYADDFEAALIYVREAHPGDNYPQSHNHQEKQQKAHDFCQLYQLDLPVIVDSVDGDLHQRLDTKPNSLHIIDLTGEVLFQALWAGDIDEIETATEQIAKVSGPTETSVSICFCRLFAARAICMRHSILLENALITNCVVVRGQCGCYPELPVCLALCLSDSEVLQP